MTKTHPTLDGKGLGALPDPPDKRDLCYSDYLATFGRPQEPPPPKGEVAADAEVGILDQGTLGSCTANEGVAHYAILLVKQGEAAVILSRLEVYRDARILLDPRYADEDSGATGRTVAKTLAKKGACLERDWPYRISKFQDAPPDVCTRQDNQHNVLQYLSIPARHHDTLTQIKTSLAAGYPVGFSIDVHANFKPDRSGVIPEPSGNVLGGHRILLVGYDDATQLFTVRNSWGTNWGVGGRCFFHYDHIQKGASDFWTYRLVEG